MKIGPNVAGTVEKRSGGTKMKTGLDALLTAENGSENLKHEKWTLHLQYRRIRVQERKMDSKPSIPPKTGP
jgi:hypothetical protein